LPAEHPLTTAALVALGGLLVDQDRPDEAEPMLGEALVIREQTLRYNLKT
jgi:hypothetical protein